MDSRKSPFEEYFESIYAKHNLLTPKEYENTARIYGLNYGDHLPVNKDVQILDIGCGTGHFLYYLRKMGYTNYFGIDLSPGQIEFCKNNITPNVELADAFEYLPNQIGVYDVISANDILEHIQKEKVITLLEVIYRSLKPGGLLLLKIPNMSSPFALDLRYQDFTHELGFTEKSIYQVLYVAGFREISIYPYIFRNYERSIRAYIHRVLGRLVDAIFKKIFWYQGFPVPEILNSPLVVIAKK